MFISKDSKEVLFEQVTENIQARNDFEKRIAALEEMEQQSTSLYKEVSRYSNNELCYQELRIVLTGKDLRKFRKTSIYPQLIKYMKRLEKKE